jgi:hypothetical protein
MTDFTWNISFSLTGSYAPAGGATITNQTATVTGTIVTDSDSGILHQSDFGTWSFIFSDPAVGFSGAAGGDQSTLAFSGNVFSASGGTLSYVFDPNTGIGPHAFFTNPVPSQVAFGIDLFFHNFVQADIRLQDSNFNQLDGIVTQPFQIGTEVVGTLSGISEIGTNDITLDLSAIFNVGGNVTISNNDQLLSIDLSHLLSVGGDFTVTNNGMLLTLSLPSLTAANGSIDIVDDPVLTSVSMPGLTNAGGVDVSNDPLLGTVDLSSLTTANGSVDINNDPVLTSVSMTGLTNTGSVDVSNDPLLGTVDLSSLTTANGSVDINDDPVLTSVSMTNLTNAGSVNFNGDTSLITLDLSALVHAGAVVISNDGVVTLDFSKLVTAGGDVSITDNSHLLTVDLGSLDSTNGNVTIGSAADAKLDASALGPGGGTVELIGDNLTTTITLGSLAHMQGVLSINSADGVTLTSHAGLGELDITGTAHDDTLIGSLTAKNVIDAGAGNDLMSGGAADDSFVFDFSVSQHTEFHHDFVSLANVTSVAIGSSIYFKPAPTASITAWQVWDNALTTYANSQAENTGGDHFTAFTNSNPVAKNDGTIKLIDGYFHDYNATVANVSGSGFDTVSNFANSALSVTNGGGGNDTLVFNGLSNDPTAANYWGNWLSSTTQNGNTVIDVHDVAHHGADVSSITLLGVTTDVATLVHDHIIQFQHPEWAI